MTFISKTEIDAYHQSNTTETTYNIMQCTLYSYLNVQTTLKVKFSHRNRMRKNVWRCCEMWRNAAI